MAGNAPTIVFGVVLTAVVGTAASTLIETGHSLQSVKLKSSVLKTFSEYEKWSIAEPGKASLVTVEGSDLSTLSEQILPQKDLPEEFTGVPVHYTSLPDGNYELCAVLPDLENAVLYTSNGVQPEPRETCR